MAYIDGTRTATLTCDVANNIKVHMPQPFVAQIPEEIYDIHQTDWSFGGHLGFLVSCNISTYTYSPSPGSSWDWEVRANLSANNGHGTTVTNTVVLASGTETSAVLFKDVATTANGSVSCSVSVDKLWDISEVAFSSTVAPTRYPAYTTYNWYEKTTAEATATATITIGGGSASASAAATSRQNADYTATLAASGICSGVNTHDFGITNVKVNGRAVKSWTHSHTKADQTASQWAYTLKGEGTAPYCTTAAGTISTYACLERSVSMTGRIRAWDGAYPDTVEVDIVGYDGSSRTVTASSGSWAGTDTFNYYASSTYLLDPTSGSSTHNTSLNDVPSTISAGIQYSDLVTLTDDPAERLVRFRGWRFNGIALTSTNNRSVAGTGNDRTYSPQEGFSGYRYLDIQVKCVTGTSQPGVIEITDFKGQTKRYNVTAATTSYATVTIDLCSPSVFSAGALPPVDGKDNPYPRKNTTSASGAGGESTDSAYWGITSASRLRVYSGNIDIGTTTLKYTASDSTFVPSAMAYGPERKTIAIVSEADTTTYFYARRFWQQDRDARTEEESDVWWQKTVGGVSGVTVYTVQGLTIANFKTELEATDSSILRHPGWTATVSVAWPGAGTCTVSQPPLTSCYLNGDTGLASWLHGHGCLVTPNATSGHDFTYGHQVADGTITAQTVFDAINGSFPPDLDDPFSVNGGTDAGLYLPGVNILRGIAHGLVYDKTGIPTATMLSNVTLERQSDAQNRGTDSALDSTGRFYTATPWHFGETNHDIKYNGTSTAALPSRTAKRDRAVFREPSSARYIATAVAPSQRATYGVISDSDVAVIYHASGPAANNWVSTDTPLTGCNAIAIAYDPTSSRGRLHLAVGKATGGIDGHYTDDEGVTTSVAVTVAATGKNPAVAISPIGKRIVLYTNASALYRVVYDPQGNVITAASAIVASGVSDAPTAIGWRYGMWYAFYRDTSNALIQITSVDDGEVWS